jgi:lipid A ethanolaminephosphotransferase
MTTFIIVLAVYFGTVLNYPVINRIFELGTTVPDVWFPYTAPFLLFFCFLIIFSLFAWPYFFKPCMAFMTLTSAAALYASINFNTLFDSTMMENIFETNRSEASSYLNLSSFLYVFVFGIIPTIFIFFVKIVPRKTWVKAIISRVTLVVVGIVGIGFIYLISYKDYASVGRNNPYLNTMIIPGHMYHATHYIDKNYFSTKLPYRTQGVDAKVIPSPNGKPSLFVFVLGETARAQNVAYNGYHRDTNPYTKRLGVIPFQDVSSCGTYTALSVPCMFSSFNRTNYNKERAKSQDNALDVISHAGVETLWIDNDGGDKGVANNITYKVIDTSLKNEECNGTTCFDSVMLGDAAQFFDKDDNNKLLVLHAIGSHGPTYWQRYPKKFGVFQPSCDTNDIEKCSDEEIVNVYDNTLVYTDYILSQVIEKLKTYSDRYNVAMMYLSDHGESLGENGFYLHGTPYAIAPKEQTSVPWLLWLPPQYAEQKGLDVDCIKRNAATKPYSHDNVFHSLMGLYGITSKVIDPSLDLTQECRTH